MSKSLEFGTRGQELGAAGSVSGTEMIVKAYEDSVVTVTANWGVNYAEITKQITLTSQGTIEGVSKVTWVSGYVVAYK